MESSRKRKAAPATPSASEAGATKRLRLLNSNHGSAAQKDTQAVGQRLVDQLQRATDKTGRLIATEFLTLPSKSKLPDYYRVIKLPVSVETIADKVKRNAYPDISAIESDFKRLIQNAKEYNAPKSEVYEDAERIRKLVSNFMRSNNPAYENDPHYQAAPTPIPGEENTASTPHVNERSHASRRDPRTAPRSTRRTSEATPARRKSLSRSVATPAKQEKASEEEEEEEVEEEEEMDAEEDQDNEEENEEDEDEEGAKKDETTAEGASGPTIKTDFTGKTLQEAQEALLEELISYTDEEGLVIYTPFVYLPSRKLDDYYKLIKHPVSLQNLLKRIRGVQGRSAPTHISAFKNWDQLEEEASYVWRNAQEYNEDESEMYQLAESFKKHFLARLADAKAQVEIPTAPKIKIGGPKPKVTLNLSSHRSSPSPTLAADSDVIVRSRSAVANAANGVQPPAARTADSSSVVPSTTAAVPSLERSGSGANGISTLSTVKNEQLATQSPGPRPSSVNGTMAPPVARPTSASPLPPTSLPNYLTYTLPIQLPAAPKRTFPVSEALLPTVTLATHPQLKIPKAFSLAIPPHPTLTHQSTTVTLPATHYFVQIAPTISKQLSAGRPYKMFVTLNGIRLNQRDTVFHSDTGRRSHVYEGSLAPGVNRVEIEVAAAKREANGELSEKGLDVEKLTVYVNLMR